MKNLENHAARVSGLLVPFRAMPGDHDHQGTLGDVSAQFLNIMHNAGFSVLHDLPNTPPDGFNCPYSSVSAFALDPQRIDLEYLAIARDITVPDLNNYQKLVSLGNAGPSIRLQKELLLKRAFKNFDNAGSFARKESFANWRDQEAAWVEPYAAFEILKNLPQNKNRRWQDWETGKDFSPKLIAEVKAAHPSEFSAINYMQWVAEDQTMQYLKTSRQLGIDVWGDVPFYVGAGEVWANRNIFNVDAYGNQLNQGGAAPSPTSSTGQIWGNATYKIDPENHPIDTGKAIDWWVSRLKRAYKLNPGKVRLDHFIGFAEPYIIAADAPDGQDGWRENGVGEMLFDKLVEAFGDDLPFCPEDLGSMTERTPQLRDKYDLPTTALAVRALTKDLAVGNYEKSPNNPDNYRGQTVGFSGNHDSPTLIQALDTIRTAHPDEFGQYVDRLRQRFPGSRLNEESTSADISQLEMERVIGSVGQCSILAIWDVLGLGPDARYNEPGTVSKGNWAWRMDSRDLRKLKSVAPTWHDVNKSSGRLPSTEN